LRCEVHRAALAHSTTSMLTNRAKRIPRVIRLPFGYVVQVRQVTVKEMQDALDDEDDVPDGAWISDDMTIYLRRTLTMARKRYVLCHELQHAAADLTHHTLNEGTAKP
jgi:Zn-dependent peptidase ImmA (M78 family)